MKLYQTVDEIANSISCDDVDKCKFLIENCDVNEQKMDDEVQHVIENRFTSMITNNNNNNNIFIARVFGHYIIYIILINK